MRYDDGSMMDGGAAGWILTALLGLGLWLLLGVAAFAAWRALVAPAGGRRPRSGPSPADPEQVLAERLARGEIDAEDYRQRRDLLRSDG